MFKLSPMNRPLALKLSGLGAIVLGVACHYPNASLAAVFVAYSAVLVALSKLQKGESG